MAILRKVHEKRMGTSRYYRRDEQVHAYVTLNFTNYILYVEYIIMRDSKAIPAQALRTSGVAGYKVSRKLAYEGGKAVSPKHRSPLLHRRYSLDSCLSEAESILWP